MPNLLRLLKSMIFYMVTEISFVEWLKILQKTSDESIESKTCTWRRFALLWSVFKWTACHLIEGKSDWKARIIETFPVDLFQKIWVFSKNSIYLKIVEIMLERVNAVHTYIKRFVIGDEICVNYLD